MAKTHGVVVIHGQGQARFRGSILAQLLNGTIGALEAGGYDVERTIELDKTIPRARLALSSTPPLVPDGSLSPLDGEAIEFREAFWDDAFPAPSTDDVVRWVLMGIRSRAAGMLGGWFGQPRTVAANGFSILDWIAKVQTLLLTIVLAASLLLTSVIQPIAWLLFTASRMPIVSGFGIAARFGAAIQSLNPFLQTTLGDSQRLVTDRAWAATIRTRLETPLLELLDNDEISDITIVAHSAGAAVAYEALFQGSPVARRANTTEKPIRLITMGSGINHLWAFASMRNNGVPERVALAEGHLDPDVVARAGDTRSSIDTFWTDLYARFDYVAAGPTGAQIVAHSGLEDGKHFRAHRVINYDHLVDDHGGYFRNKEQVIPRLLPVIVQRITWWRTQPPPKEGTGVRLAHLRRTKSVTWLSTAKLLPAYLLAAHFVLYWKDLFGWRDQTEAFGATLSRFPMITDLSSRLHEFAAIDPQHAAFLITLTIASLLVSRSLYTWWKPKVDDEGLSWLRGLAHLARHTLLVPIGWLASYPVEGAITAVLLASVLLAGDFTGWVPVALILVAVILFAFAGQLRRITSVSRDHRWVRHRSFGASVLVIALLLALFALIWLPGRINQRAFQVSTGPRGNNVQIVSSEGHVALFTGPDTELENRCVMGLSWENGGYGILGPVRPGSDANPNDAVSHDLLLSDDSRFEQPPIGPARVSTTVFRVERTAEDGRPETFSARGIALQQVDISYAERTHLAYRADGSDSWAIIVHGKGGTREEGLRVLPLLNSTLGMTVLSIAYRNDPESPEGSESTYEYGVTEADELIGAVEYARRAGAERILLYGYSMGGGVIAAYLEQPLANRSLVAAVVLDAPMVDLQSTIEHAIRRTPVIGHFAGPLARAAEFRLGRSFDDAAYIDSTAREVDELDLSMLILHQRGDHLVPIETSRRLAGASTRITLHEFPPAGHTRAWNDDPLGYEALVAEFVANALGESNPGASTATTELVGTRCAD